MFNKKLKHFKHKLNNIDKAMWDLEFKRSKSSQIREEIRLQRDRAVEGKLQMEAQTPEGKEAKEAHEKELAKLVDNIKRYEAQVEMIDAEIHGKQPTDTEPGQSGINDQLESLAELREMTKSYIKTL